MRKSVLAAVLLSLLLSAAAAAAAAAAGATAVRDEPFLQLVSTRFMFAGAANPAAWPVVDGVQSNSYQSIATAPAYLSSAVLLLTNSALFALSAPEAGSLAVESLASDVVHVLPNSTLCVSPAGTVIIATPDTIYICSEVRTVGSVCSKAAGVGLAMSACVSDDSSLWLIGNGSLFVLPPDAPLPVLIETVSGVPEPIANCFALGHSPSLGLVVSSLRMLLFGGADGSSDGNWTFVWRHGDEDSAARAMVFHGETLYLAGKTSVNSRDANGAYGQFVGIDRDPWQAGLPRYNLSSAAVVTPHGNAIGAGSAKLWFGGLYGVVALDTGDWRWHNYAGPRWLPSNNVDGLAAASSGGEDGAATMFVVTGGGSGLALLAYTTQTLAAKAAAFQTIIDTRHVWLGLTADVGLAAYGQVDSWYQTTSDNDGLWTAIYAASQAYAYAATGSETARANAWLAFEGLELLYNVTGIPGYFARSVWPRGQPPTGGIWVNSTAPGYEQYQYKSDSSSDEAVGHFFAYPLIYDLVAAEGSERARVQRIVNGITGELIAHDWYLISETGKHTEWGIWNPKWLNDKYSFRDQRGINSLQILSFLAATHHITGNATYAAAAEGLIQKYGYGLNIINTKVTWAPDDNYSDDELAWLPLHTLTWTRASSPIATAQAALAAERLFAQVMAENSPLWNYMFAASVAEPADDWLGAAAESLRIFPMEWIDWPVNNEGRRDTILMPNPSRSSSVPDEALRLIPYDESHVRRWNTNPFTITPDGSGFSETDPSAWLLPYWMGRYYKYIV